MQLRKWTCVLVWLLALLIGNPALGLKSDRQQPLDIDAESSEGTLGDGTATFRSVEVRQGSLLIRADAASVEKVDGRVRRIELTGKPVYLQQDIEGQGTVTAEANHMVYEVASSIVTLTGAADVRHPQYHISGDMLQYDLNTQDFQGSGGDEEGRIRIQLDPEMVPQSEPAEPDSDSGKDTAQQTDEGDVG